jgi:hypothetical protein
MKRKRMAAAAIVVAVVAVGLGYLVLKRGSGLPVYLGAVQTSLFGSMYTVDNFVAEWSGLHVPSGIDITGYMVTDGLDTVMEWYRWKMPKEGWTLLYDNSGYENTSYFGNILIKVVICEREGMRAGIIALNYQGTTYFALISAQKEVFGQFISIPGEGGPVIVHRFDMTLYAGLINENVVRIRIRHEGGDTIDDPIGKFGGGGGKNTSEENTLYGWTFKNTNQFRKGDLGQCELSVHGANFEISDMIWVKITCAGKTFYDGRLMIENISQLPV